MRNIVFSRENLSSVGEIIDFPVTSHPALDAGKLHYKHIEVNIRGRTVRSWGNPLHLQPLEFDLLIMLVRNKGFVLARDRLLDEVWGIEFEGYTRAVDNGISKLRTKLALKQYLVSVPKIGYKLIE